MFRVSICSECIPIFSLYCIPINMEIDHLFIVRQCEQLYEKFAFKSQVNTPQQKERKKMPALDLTSVPQRFHSETQWTNFKLVAHPQGCAAGVCKAVCSHHNENVKEKSQCSQCMLGYAGKHKHLQLTTF